MRRRRRRLPRLLLNAAIAVSLVFCVAVIALWARSYFVADTVYAPSSAASHAAFTSTRGMLHAHGRHRPFSPATLQRMRQRGDRVDSVAVTPGGYGREAPYDVDTRPPTPTTPGLRRAFSLAGISWVVADGGPLPTGGDVAPFWRVTLPHGLLAVLFATLPLARLAPRHRRRPSGTCPACGYDLRATPERCPECGTIPAR